MIGRSLTLLVGMYRECRTENAWVDQGNSEKIL